MTLLGKELSLFWICKAMFSNSFENKMAARPDTVVKF